MRLALAVASLALALPLALPVSAQDWKGPGRLVGRVTDEDRHPLQATVVLELPGRGGTRLVADKKGQWAILGLADGAWNLDFSAEGYAARRITVRVIEAVRVPTIEIQLARQAAAAPPPSNEAVDVLTRGDAAYAAGQYAEARVLYERLRALRPDLAATLDLQIARCYSQEKEYAKELDALQRVIDADPANVTARKVMVLEAINGGFFDRAAQLAATLDAAAARDPELLFNAAVAYFNKDRLKDAVAFLDRALAVAPDADSYFLRGQAHLGLGEMDAAKADLRRFVEVAPEDARVATAKSILAKLP
jgi:tetratricopeptide (TPR) repeat protein